MKEAMARDRTRIDAALAQLSGEYRIATATRNMLMVIAGLIVPLLILIVVRVLGNFLPSVVALAAGGLLGLVLFCLLVDLIVGALRFDAHGVERRSPWFWWNWRVVRDDITALGVIRAGKGRHLVIETATGLRRRLPFRPGFERVLAVIG
jgi:hypothetical protein